MATDSFRSISISIPFNESLYDPDGGSPIHWHVPGTVTSLLFLPGDPISSEAMRTTLRNCRSDIARASYWEGGFAAIHPDPYAFPDTGARETGLELLIWSQPAAYTTSAGGLTWRQLDAVIQGLQQAMYNAKKFQEAQFMIYDGLTAVREQGTGELYSLKRGSSTS